MELGEGWGVDSQFIILILQTFPVTSKPTLKGHVLLASISVTTKHLRGVVLYNIQPGGAQFYPCLPLSTETNHLFRHPWHY